MLYWAEYEDHNVYITSFCANKDILRLTKSLHDNKILRHSPNIKDFPWLKFMSENLMKIFSYANH